MAQRKRRRGRHARSRGNEINTKNRGSRSRGGQTTRSLGFEPLEDRRLLAVYLVNDLGDFDGDGNVIAGSLRNAVAQANTNGGFDTILFSDSLFFGPGSGSISLDGREEGGPLLLTDTDGVQILGPGAGVLTVFAPGGNRIFFIDDGNDEVRAPAIITGITLSGGSPAGDDEDGVGGAILNREALTLTEVLIENSSAIGGGAIFNDVGALLTVDRSLIQNNSSSAGGGGIQNGIAGEEEQLARTTILNSTITGNSANGGSGNEAGYGGGGVLNLAGTVNIEQSTFYGNSASAIESGGGVATQGFDPGDTVTPLPPIEENFDTGNFSLADWVTPAASDAPWTFNSTISVSPSFSAQAGLIADNQSSSLEIVLTTGAGFVSFSRKVSSELDKDFLKFFIDGMEKGSYSGDQDFAEVMFPVTDGEHTFLWTYEKDGSGMDGDDTAYLDDIMFPAVLPPSEATTFSGFATTNIRSSIIVGNTAANTPDDVGSLGVIDGDPPVRFQPQINSLGYNLFGVLTHPPATINPAVVLPPNGIGDVDGVNPIDVFIDDPFAMSPVAWLNDFGGELPVFMPDFNKAGGQMAIDMGDPFVVRGNFEQRGSHFTRVFDLTDTGSPRMDIGAAEVQVGNFVVDTLVDETDGRYGEVPISVGTFPGNFLSTDPDFSLREALEFAQKNSLVGLADPDEITFSSILTDPQVNPDPTLGTPPPTILLTLGELFAVSPVIIQGPAFDLEVDATGNDPTPGVNDGQGSRVFNVFSTVEINNLILRGGDHPEFGGAIFTTGDLTVKNSTLLDNVAARDGGAIYVGGGTLLVDSSTIHSNTALLDGGGIFIASGDATVSNSTISGNLGVLRGGGIAHADGTLLVQYSTITLNTAGTTLGSGVASFRDASAATSFRSSIISGNAVTDVQQIKPGANTVNSLGANLVGTGNAVTSGLFASAFDQVNVINPLLSPLARLGGPTPTHRVLPGSPALDAGDPNAAGIGNVPAQDQRGFPFDRVEGANPIDIGAFETQDGQILIGDVTMGANFATFVEALDDSNASPASEEIIFLPSWLGEFFPSVLTITDSVDIFGDGNGIVFPDLEFLIDDGNNGALQSVTFDDFRFQNDARIVSKENLTLKKTEFVSNTAVGKNGGAISQQFGKLTITDSLFSANTVSGSGSSGGAIHVLDGDLEINNSFLSGNSAGVLAGKGGAIYLRNGNFTGDYLYITGNTATAATGEGGGFYVRDSTVSLTNAVISGNSTNGSDSWGGGVSARDTDITLVNTSVSLNTTISSQSGGGGIFLDGGSLNFQGGNFFGNKTHGQISSGGGLEALNADVTITGASVSGNEVHGLGSQGGGLYVVGGSLTVRDSEVSNNLVNGPSANGGGIYVDGDLSGTQTTSIINSTISGNSTLGRGGGLFNAEGLTVIKHSTITNNDAPYIGDAAGVGSFGNSSTTRTEVYSSIIAGNIASQASAVAALADFSGDGEVNGFDFLSWQKGFGTSPAAKTDGDANGDLVVDAIDLGLWDSGFGVGDTFSDVDRVGGTFDETFLSMGYNLIGEGLSVGAFSATGDQTGITDPKLDLLANNGGPTRTHALLTGSPALDAGDPAFNPNNTSPTLSLDQRGFGFSRVEGTTIDIGAFELTAPMPLLAPVMSGSEESSEAPLASSADVTVEEVAFASIRIDAGAQLRVAPAALEETPVVAHPVQASLSGVRDETLRDLTNYVAQLRARHSFVSPSESRLAEISPTAEVNNQAIREAAHDTLLAVFADHRVDPRAIAEALSNGQDLAASEDAEVEDLIFDLLGEENL